MTSGELYEFGPFTLDVSERRLVKRDGPVVLPPKTFDVLVALLRQAGRLVTKHELLRLVWPDSFVEEGILAVHISSLRKALGEASPGQSYIETVSRSGYRFFGDATRQPETVSELSPTPLASTSSATIAVLPFLNMSADPEHEYFSDGLTEEIINTLMQVPGLKVIARTSSFAFKDARRDVRWIAAMLGVAHVLEGGVRRSGQHIRVTAQLIVAADGSHLWSERYEGEMADVFAVQDEIARAIASALKLRLSSMLPPARRHAPTLPAYEAHLKALYHQRQFTPESLAKSKGYFEQAVALDPQFALARTERGRLLFSLVTSDVYAAHEGMPLVRAAAQDALAIDPSSRDGHALLGLVATTYDYDWGEAERRFHLATMQEPVSPSVGVFYSMYLAAIGRTEDGVRQLEHALLRDPFDLVGRALLGSYLDVAGRTDEASAQLRQALEFNENFWLAHFFLGVHQGLRGHVREALPFAEKAYALAPWFPGVVGLLAGLLVRTGDQGRAERLLGKLRSDQAYSAPIGWCAFHLLCSEINQAADWIEQAIRQRHPRAIVMLSGPPRNLLRSSSRWPALAKLMNLPEPYSP